MTSRFLPLAAALLLAGAAHAESFTSSASSAASTSSASISESFHSVSNSSSGHGKVAAGPYTVTQVAQAADGRVQLALAPAGGQAQAPFTLTLPQALVAEQGLQAGESLHLQARAYGYAIARSAAASPFFLVVEDGLKRDFESVKL